MIEVHIQISWISRSDFLYFVDGPSGTALNLAAAKLSHVVARRNPATKVLILGC